MRHAAFVLAPPDLLPEAPASWDDLRTAQSGGIALGEWFRMYEVPGDDRQGLADKIRSGAAGGDGSDPFPDQPGGGTPICDALIPRIATDSLWLGIYQLSGPTGAAGDVGAADQAPIEVLDCLDRLPLSAIGNETCWFYPTEDGAYLCWRSLRRLRLRPGRLADPPPEDTPQTYRRDQLRLLWSLMADDTHLTCVGLTYGRRRIDWPVHDIEDTADSTWTHFRVDSMAGESDTYQLIESHTLGT